MDVSRDDRLKDYLTRVLDAQHQAGRVLHEGELRDIAYRVGLSDEDLAMADQAAHDKYQRGMEMLRARCFDEALDALADAVALSPGWLQYRLKLAQVYVARWRATGRAHDRRRAEELARECMEIDRDNTTARSILQATSKSTPSPEPQRPVHLASAGQHPRPTPSNVRPPQKKGGGGLVQVLLVVFAAIGISTTACVGMFAALIAGSAEQNDDGSFLVGDVEPVEQSEVFDEALLDDIAALDSAVAYRGLEEGEIIEGARGLVGEPIEVLSHQPIPLTYQVLFSQRKDFASGKTFFKSGMYFRWDGAGRVTKITGRYQFVDADGVVLATQSRLILSNLGERGGANPGEVIPERFIHEVPLGYERVLLVLEQVETKPELAVRSSSDYEPLKWSVSGPKESLTVLTHTSEFSGSLLKPGMGFYKMTVGLKYDAAQGAPVETLRAKIRSLDTSGRVIQEDTWYMVGSLNLPLFPREERVLRRTLSVPMSFDRAEIVVDKFGTFEEP
ncbi:MAG: hypothetical protein AAGI01_04390 [Myxococcota bacterium]